MRHRDRLAPKNGQSDVERSPLDRKRQNGEEFFVMASESLRSIEVTRLLISQCGKGHALGIGPRTEGA
jgi:hypothetical protein